MAMAVGASVPLEINERPISVPRQDRKNSPFAQGADLTELPTRPVAEHQAISRNHTEAQSWQTRSRRQFKGEAAEIRLADLVGVIGKATKGRLDIAYFELLMNMPSARSVEVARTPISQGH